MSQGVNWIATYNERKITRELDEADKHECRAR